MSEPDATPTADLALSETIALLRDELAKAIQADGSGAGVHLPVESMTVELVVTATRSADGKTEFTVPINIRPDAGGSREATSAQKVTVVFGAPVDISGSPVKISRGIEDWDRP